MDWSGNGYVPPVRLSRKLATLATAAALCVPIAACGEDDVKDQVNQSAKDVRDKAKEVGGSLDDLSKKDLRKALDDAERTADNSSGDAKREARKLQRKIERELDSR